MHTLPQCVFLQFTACTFLCVCPPVSLSLSSVCLLSTRCGVTGPASAQHVTLGALQQEVTQCERWCDMHKSVLTCDDKMKALRAPVCMCVWDGRNTNSIFVPHTPLLMPGIFIYLFFLYLLECLHLIRFRHFFYFYVFSMPWHAMQGFGLAPE